MKKRILIVVYALLLCVTASFAWLSNFNKTNVKDLHVDFRHGALTVTDPGFQAFIETRDANGNFVRIPDGVDGEQLPYTFNHKDMVPDTITPFKIKIKNNSSTEERKAKLGIALRIDPEAAKVANILEVMYIDVIAGDGFSDDENYHIYMRLDEASVVGNSENGEYFLWLYGEGSEIIIPPTSDDKEYVTLDCSFYYDQNATAKYQNQSIFALSFRLE